MWDPSATPASSPALRSAHRGRLWLAGLLLACLVAGLVGLASARGLGPDPFKRLLGLLPVALLIGGSLHVLFRRKVTVSTSWLGFLLVCSVLLGSSELGQRRLRADASRAGTAALPLALTAPDRVALRAG